MEKTLTITDELRIIYQEVLEGCSPSPNGKVFIRHFCEIDHIEILRKRIQFFNDYLTQGIPSEEDRYKQIIENQDWSQDEEDRITSLRYMISDNEREVSKMLMQPEPGARTVVQLADNVQKMVIQRTEGIKKIIELNKRELIQLLMKKNIALGSTADDLSAQDVNQFAIFLSLFKDRECKTPMFQNWEEFDSLPEPEQAELSGIMETTIKRVTEPKIRQLSVMPFFLNNFSFCKEDVSVFLNRAVANLTSYQSLLFSLGLRNLNIMAHSNGHPPEMINGVTPDDVLTWYDHHYSLMLRRNMKV